MPSLNFSAQFAGLVSAGRKTQTIPGTHDDPEDPGGVFLEGVRCVAMRIGDGEPLPAESLDAIQCQAMELFKSEIGDNAARAECARAWDEERGQLARVV